MVTLDLSLPCLDRTLGSLYPCHNQLYIQGIEGSGTVAQAIDEGTANYGRKKKAKLYRSMERKHGLKAENHNLLMLTSINVHIM